MKSSVGEGKLSLIGSHVQVSELTGCVAMQTRSHSHSQLSSLTKKFLLGQS